VGPTQNFTGPTLINNSKAKTVIIAGTIGKSDVITRLINTKKLDVSAIEGQWESFISEVISNPLPGVDKALVIAGADLRGTIFGLYDVSEQIGVSPWWWFADVAVRKASGIWALGGYLALILTEPDGVDRRQGWEWEPQDTLGRD
jgi:hypothetical protein